jgi:transcriptional regulator with XRE-family HTH domain
MKEVGDSLRNLRRKARVSSEEGTRGYKRVTQELLAERLGWSNAAHVSQIENGLRLPQAETIQRWVIACEGSMSEMYYLLGIAGYLPPTKFPPKQAFIPTLELVDLKTLINHPYPAYIVDYRSVLWVVNSATALFISDATPVTAFVGGAYSLFHFIFDPRLPVRNRIHNWEEYHRRQLLLFKMYNMLRQHEPFYKNFVEDTGKRLLPENAAELRRSWEETPMDAVDLEVLNREPILLQLTPDIVIQFHHHTENIFNIADLFIVIRFEPDANTPQEYLQVLEAICEPLRGKPSAKLWEQIDIDSLIEHYDYR